MQRRTLGTCIYSSSSIAREQVPLSIGCGKLKPSTTMISLKQNNKKKAHTNKRKHNEGIEYYYSYS